MKGFAMLSKGKAGWIEKDAPTCGSLDAIIRPTAVAPCSSDTSIINDLDLPNVILGHESLGIVEEVGELVTKFKPGDRVVVPCCTPDWEEPSLQERGINNAHDTGWIKSFKFMITHDGVFAEHFKVNNANANLVHMPEGVSVEDALMTVDMMSTGFYAAENANIQFGDTVVVFGIGPVGLIAVAAARLPGAGRIFAVGTRPNCVKLAREYGATDIISYKDGDTVKQILDANGGQVDRAIIAIHDVECMNQALQLVRCNGNISSIACISPTETYSVPAMLFGLGESDITIKNGFCPGGAYRVQKMLELIKYDRVHPGKLLNYTFDGFDKIEEAFWTMANKPRDLVKPIVYIEK